MTATGSRRTLIIDDALEACAANTVDPRAVTA
jgi:hypothetical protein